MRHRLTGLNASPYSIKMRAILRYRRMPFDWHQQFAQTHAEQYHVRPVLLPVLELGDDGTQHVDTTPVAQMLEDRYGTARSIYPGDPGHRFLALLIEDFADEWMTKPLFWYRWSGQRDIDYATRWLARDAAEGRTGAELRAFGDAIAERQIGRMGFVGCTAENAALVEASYLAVLDAMAPIVEEGQFLFGNRPSIADFALYGMLRQLGTDPTPRDIMQARLPALRDWLDRVDDASGISGDWGAPSAAVETLVALTGRIYVPFLLANEAAFNAGETSFAAKIDGHAYGQDTFPYQVKCLSILRREYGDLGDADRAAIGSLLDDAGWTRALALTTGDAA